MSTIANFQTDVAGHVAYAPMPSQNIYTTALVASTATSITVPSNFEYWIVAFSYQPGISVWVNFTGATAAVPAGSTLATSTSTLNPGARTVKKGSTISIITPTVGGGNVSIEFYALLQGN